MTSLRRGRALAMSATLLSALASPAPSHAYCRTTTDPLPASYSPTKGCFTEGLLLFWKNACVGYSVQSAGSARVAYEDAVGVVDQAFATWTASQCSEGQVGISASNLGPVECTEVRYNPEGPNQNLIVFRDTSWPYNDPNNTLGLTTVTFNSETGEIYDADMEINASGRNLSISDTPPANGFDLLSVVTHEAGHFFGLAHATDAKATMYASYKPGTIALRSLTTDDVEGICAIYPNATTRIVTPSVAPPSGVLAAEKCDSTPRHGFTKSCAESTSSSSGCSVGTASGDLSPWSLLALAPLAGLVVTRRRRLGSM